MNKRNIEKLAKHLDSVPRRGFDMNDWIRPARNQEGEASLKDLRKAVENKFRCGMAACVGGHAAMLFGFKKCAEGEKRCFICSTQQSLGLCSTHNSQLTTCSAAHQTPKAAARFLRKLAKENPACCNG